MAYMVILKHTYQYGKSYKIERRFTPCCLKGSPTPPSLLFDLNQDWYSTTYPNCSSIVTLLGLLRVSNCPSKLPFILVDLYGCPSNSHLCVLM